jgi:hypothetical protein
MKDQKEAVYSATMSVLADRGIAFEDGQNLSEFMTKDIRDAIQAIVTEGFSNGEVEFRATESNKAKLADRSKLSSYVSGLCNNWFRKDKRLNGAVTYVAKNPGSRVTDPQLKALKNLAKIHAGTDKLPAIQAEITKRSAELGASKVKTVEVDMSLIPAELKATLGIE